MEENNEINEIMDIVSAMDGESRHSLLGYLRVNTNHGSDDDKFCSFCGRSNREVETLILGPQGANICNRCVESCLIPIELDPGIITDYRLNFLYTLVYYGAVTRAAAAEWLGATEAEFNRCYQSAIREIMSKENLADKLKEYRERNAEKYGGEA